MKKIHYIYCILFAILLFIPMNLISGAGEYAVAVIDTNGHREELGTFDNYPDALDSMNQYSSNMEKVACIFRNGTLVNTKYGVFRPNQTSTVTFYTDYGNRYFSPSYNSEALVLGYDPGLDRIKIKISGAVGYIESSKGTVQPISFLTTSGSNLSYDTSKNYIQVVSLSSLRLRVGPGLQYTHLGCNDGVTSCSSGKWASRGSIYEWLNKGSTTIADGYEWIKVNVNGEIGYVANDPADIYVQEYIPNPQGNRENYVTYYYVNSKGNLVHQYYATVASDNIWAISLGPAPKWLKQNKNYYSFDGNYFYETFASMVQDETSNTTTHAVNKTPYYNYYQYLPSRTKTTYAAENINAYLTANGYYGKIDRDQYYSRYYDENLGRYKWQLTWDWDNFAPNLSMLYGEGDSFIKSQNLYGVNALQTFALSVNESGWGRSYISVREYNIFGHGAFDSSPDEFATGYASIQAGIMAHAYKYIALDYDNPVSGSHYYGGHYGNKLSGNNVSYASDAYWGEKMANQYASFDSYYGYQEFRKNVKIGVKQKAGSKAVYKEPSSKSSVYYSISSVPNIPISILDVVKGEAIDGNDIWYKIQSDIPIDENRNALDIKQATYNYETSYAYIHSKDLYVEEDAPTIKAEDQTIKVGEKLENEVSAWDAWDGQVNVTLKASDLVNNVPGTYSVIYEASDQEGHTTTKTIQVKVVEDSNPAIEAKDIELELYQSFNPKDYVKAHDYEDGNLTDKVEVLENTVDTNKEGTYKVTYSVTDSSLKTVKKTIQVVVKEKNYEQKDGIYFFETLKDNNGMYLKGALAINDVLQTLETEITYQLIFTEENTEKRYVKPLNRITNKDEIPFPIEESGMYSWFDGNISLDDLENGNYTLSVKSISGSYASEVPLSNVFLKEMATTISVGNRKAFFRNNLESRNAPIQLFLREEAIGEKTSSFRYNIGNEYSTIQFKNNDLIIRGASHIIGGDYSENTNVNRKLIFEEINTLKKFEYDIGSIINGDYEIELRVSDGQNKTRAWFETKIDCSNLPIGTYSIYLSTSSNLADFGELQDIFSRPITSTLKVNNKKYHLQVDRKNRYRVLLIVEAN